MRTVAQARFNKWSRPAARRRGRGRPRPTDIVELLSELGLLEAVRDAAARYETPNPSVLADAARSAVGRVPVRDLAERASVLSVRSSESWLSVLSSRSIGSLLSFASVLSVGSAGSFGSVGSALSIGSAGSLMSIGSSGSVLSIGASGGFCTIGAGKAGQDGGATDARSGVDAATVRRISGLLAVAAMIAAPFGRRSAA